MLDAKQIDIFAQDPVHAPTPGREEPVSILNLFFAPMRMQAAFIKGSMERATGSSLLAHQRWKQQNPRT